MLYKRSADVYDALYADKDYRAEVDYVLAAIERSFPAQRSTLLDVACGSGRHLEYFKRHFRDVAGVDLSSELLRVAQRRNPNVPFFCQDMRTLSLKKTFDAVTVMFSSIAYLQSLEDLTRTIDGIHTVLSDNGVLAIEPGFTPESWRPNQLNHRKVETDEALIVRVSSSTTSGNTAEFDEHYVVATKQGTSHFVERHRMKLFSHQEIEHALTRNGYAVVFDPKGPSGRGLFLAAKTIAAT